MNNVFGHSALDRFASVHQSKTIAFSHHVQTSPYRLAKESAMFKDEAGARNNFRVVGFATHLQR